VYKTFARSVERFLRIPPRPDPPPGSGEATHIFRAAPKFYKYRLALWALKHIPAGLALAAVFALAAVGASSRSGETGAAIGTLGVVAVGAFALLAAFNYVCLRLDYENRWYVVTDRSLRIREGVVHVREMTVTYANIQNIAIEQGPLQRLLGIADLKVDTAGGGGAHHNSKHMAGMSLHTAWFSGVDNAAAIKQMIQDRLRGIKDTGLGDTDDVSESADADDADLAGAVRGLIDEARALAVATNRFAATVRPAAHA
jgi:membrane protein YdbS with pleckstrin-like domain